MQIRFNNRYHQLGDQFFQRIRPTAVPAPKLIAFNTELARQLGIEYDDTDEQTLAGIFSGNLLLENCDPIAMAYNGHQFGHFNPNLGDGRAILLGQVTAADGQPFDIQLKGSGRTRFSRDGDGRSALGPVIREYLLSEAMHRLGVPTTRALAAVTTGEQVVRNQLTPGGIMTRVSRSLVRVGTFQYLAYEDDFDAISSLVDYTIETNYPELAASEHRAADLLASVADRQAYLIARWMNLGFIHGVMNTDNMSIAGETIDYGPCAFMDGFAQNRVFSSIDRQGRYAYNQQANIGLWNLSRLAETLLPMINDDENIAVEMATRKLDGFASAWQQYWLDGMRDKLGLSDAQPQDKELVDKLLSTMASNEADFTLTFHHLTCLAEGNLEARDSLLSLFNTTTKLEHWLEHWQQRLHSTDQGGASTFETMRKANPIYIPRNHQVEAVIRAAEDDGDFEPFDKLKALLDQPFVHQAGMDTYMAPPKPHEVVQQTFCGT